MSGIKLTWTASPTASGLYAAECVARKWPLADPPLGEALAEPVAALQAALQEEYLPVEPFWSNVVPLAVNFPGQLELATVTLTKTIGRTEAEFRVNRYRGLLLDIKNAFNRAMPPSDDALAARIEALRQKWNAAGIGLLAQMVNWTEPSILVDEATVCVVQPILGGGGVGYLPYNLALIEGVPDDPVPGLPETIRLAWALSTLNLDVPRYSETIANNRLAILAALAMIPVTLTAAADIRLMQPSPDGVRRAVEAWMHTPDKTAEWTKALEQWWETYSTMRPPWPTALKGLDVLLS